jgi:type 1 glutamine amidotransferase
VVGRTTRFLRLALTVAATAALLLAPVSAAPAALARKKLVMLIAAQSYETERTLPAFGTQFLEPEFKVVVVTGAMSNASHRFSHIEEITDADILLVSVWRRAPPAEQLDLIRRYVESGRPVVGICTASHAFMLRPGASPAAGSASWPEWDKLVMGGNYRGHHPIRFTTTVTAADPSHPILTGVNLPFSSKMELNQVSPLESKAHPLLIGTIAGQPPEPVAWTFEHSGRGRTFFTPLGHPEDFANPAFQRLLVNGIRWAAGLPLPGPRPPPSTPPLGGEGRP